MSKPAPCPFPVKQVWWLINLILLVTGFLVPVVHDQPFGVLSFLNILSALLLFLPGVVFQAMTTPGKIPGLLIYLGGLLSLISLVSYMVGGLIALRRFSIKRGKKRNVRSLLLITMSGIGVTVALFLWQGHLTSGAVIMVTAIVSCFALEIVEMRSIRSNRNR